MTPELITELVLEWENEVNNGGHHQFFHNSSGDNTAETIRALETIEANTMADILRRAASRFPAGMPPKDREARRDLLWELFPDPKTAFTDLDDQFFGYPDNLSELISAFKTRKPGHGDTD
jgi:hypothetical protein